MTNQLAVQNLLKLVHDPMKWDQARDALKAAPLAPADFKTCFRTYSDADPEQHLAFDLYRIQAQDALKVYVYLNLPSNHCVATLSVYRALLLHYYLCWCDCAQNRLSKVTNVRGSNRGRMHYFAFLVCFRRGERG